MNRSRAAIISVLLLAILIFGAVYYAWNIATSIFQPVTTTATNKNISLEIKKGETTAAIADDLQKKGLIRNALAFRVWSRIKGLDTRLEAGVYNKLYPSMTISEITDQLLNGQPDAIPVLVLEGWRLEQVGNVFSNAQLTKFKTDEFLDYTRHIDHFPDAAQYPLLQQVPQGNSMEGLLFPDTYEVPIQSTARDVVNLLLGRMSATIKQNHLDTLAQQHKFQNVYQMITLASIVERETGLPEDRGNIASVYWNRLFRQNTETNGLLQADPTVQYARDSQTPPQKYWLPLNDTPTNIAPDSPYNTYKNAGLPPTPICSPGLASLQQVANPPTTDYYYFFATKGRKSIFAKTLAEFNDAQKKYPVVSQ